MTLVPDQRARSASDDPGPRINFAKRLYPLSDCYYVYSMASHRNGTLYVGGTNDLARRMTEHKSSLVPGFTRQYGVDRLVYFEEHASIVEAQEREYRMKRWQRVWKLELIEKLNPEWRDLATEIPI